LTNFKGTDRIPMWIGNKIYFSSDRNRILNIYSYDLSTAEISDVNANKTKQISVQIKADAAEVRLYLRKVDKFITGFDCSPSGKRALITARGEVFTVPKKDGAIRNLTKDSGARDKNATWYPDSRFIAYSKMDEDLVNKVYIYSLDTHGFSRGYLWRLE